MPFQPAYPDSIEQRETRWFEDFIGSAPQSGIDAWELTFLGVGRSATAGSSIAESGNAMDTTSRAKGVVKLNTGTDAAGWTCLTSQAAAFLASLVRADLRIRLNIGALDDGVDTFDVVAGFHDNLRGTTLNAVDGAWFRYIKTLNGDFWACCTAASSNADPAAPTNFQETVTAVAPTVHSARMQILRIIVETGRVRFFIDGALVATHTTVVPIDKTGVGLRIRKTAGTTSRFVQPDYVDLRLAENVEDR